MQELSLNVLDIAQNSVKAQATLIKISVTESALADTLVITVADNGRGMDEETVRRATDPFYTTRTTRKVGLGLPLFKMAAELTGGSFCLASRQGQGTEVKAEFGRSHIDRMPLGDMRQTLTALITCNPEIDFVYTHTVCTKQEERRVFTLDTRQFREVLGEVSLSEPEVAAFIGDYILENDVSLP